MIKILRKPGWVLNPSDKIVNAILNRCERNGGHCPCHNEGYDTLCPCSDYRENDVCHCTLYVKQTSVAVEKPETKVKLALEYAQNN